MKDLLRISTLCFVSLFLLAGCGDTGTDDSSDYRDRITFGTGIGGNGFALVGEGTTFSVSELGSTGQIYFKLESAADMAGRAVRLYINGGTYGQRDYTNPQSYGHYLLSSFRITDRGTFTVRAYLVEQIGPDIGRETFVAQATITMLP